MSGRAQRRGLRLHAAHAAAGAGPALEVGHEVPAEDAGLEVLPPQEAAPDQGHPADAGPRVIITASSVPCAAPA